jgi:hypothetical protein
MNDPYYDSNEVILKTCKQCPSPGYNLLDRVVNNSDDYYNLLVY